MDEATALLDMYRQMAIIRRTEKAAYDLFLAGMVKGTTHLASGHEAVAVGASAALRPDDYVFATYRGHHHAMARGASPEACLAELMSRATGLNKAKGGSMHLTHAAGNMLGSYAIVGAHLPMAVGAAWSARLRGSEQVAVAFFGDGATNQGAFHESLNMASNWKLPALYVVENNGWGEFTPTEFVIPVKDIAVRAGSYAMASAIADGMDFFDVYEKAGEAIERARAGQGPTLLECKTYRFMGHFVGDPLKYRAKEEAERWIQTRDPLERFERRAVEAGLLASGELRAIDRAVEEELAAAVRAAEAAPLPDPSEVTTDVYVGSAA